MCFQKIILSLFIILIPFGSFAQVSKNYFDRFGYETSESNSYYYRENIGGNRYLSYYTETKSRYFEGNILNASSYSEKNNIYEGQCIWYHKNGNTLAIRNFDLNGKEVGVSIYYFENGTKQKEVDFTKDLNTNKSDFDKNGGSGKVFEDNFNNSSNNWFLTKNDIGEVTLQDNKLTITAATAKGNSRYINFPIQSENYTIELGVNTVDLKNGKVGLIYGFQNWDNYNYFLISNFGFYIGSVKEEVSYSSIDGMYCASLNKNGNNNLKIESDGEKDLFYVNGELIFKTNAKDLIGDNVGFALSGFSKAHINSLKIKDINPGNSSNTPKIRDVKSSGSGIILTSNGIVATNYHVVEDAKQIFIDITNEENVKSYKAKVIQKDEINDLAILKIEDEGFTPTIKIEYSFSNLGTVDVGAQVYTIGYPLALNGLGTSAKFVDGRISSKMGYRNAINSYQTSIPVQPGNSGGPLFDKNGELAGIMVATVQNTDNVSYAIKLSYLLNLIDVLPEKIQIPNNQSLKNVSLENQIKNLSKNVVLIKCK
jgi:S1-C subfamily serine protease